MTQRMERYNKGLAREMKSCSHTLAILFEYAWSKARRSLEAGKSMLRVCLGHAGRIQAEFGENSRRIQGEFRLNSQRMHLLRFAACLILIVVGVGEMWGQETPDYSGIYYIASMANKAESATTTTYAANDPTNNFYLCPTEGWYYYVATDNFQTSDNEQPFLTTYKCKSADYHNGDPSDAVWIVRKHSSEANCYYIIQKSTGRYVISNGQINTSTNANRVRVHLEYDTNPSTLTNDDKALFEITYDTDHWDIIPHSTEGRNGNNKYLVVNNGNFNNLKADGSKADGPNGTYGTGTGGIISLYTHEDNAKFYLEDYVPTIFYNTSNQIEITVQDNETIIYTTDGSDPTDPTNSNRIEVNSNTTTFTINEINTIKAVAVVDGILTKIATFTPIVLCGDTYKYLIQSQNNAWNTTDYHFYMIPGDPENNITKVNTTSLFRPTMEWHIESAGMEDGVQFYYIVNNAAKDNSDNPYYLCYDTNGVYMDTNNDNDNKFKFKIVESPVSGTFNIIPYELRNATGNTSRFLNKNTHNANANAINLANNGNTNNTRWKFVLPSDLDKTAPFTASNASTTYYYKIASVGSNGHYIIPPTGNNTNATTSNSTNVNVVKTGAWFFEVAQEPILTHEDPTKIDWCTYYYIRNAETGEYLYFTKDQSNYTSSPIACLEMRSSIEEGNEDCFMFTWAKTAADVPNYYIVPKKLKDKFLNNISSLRKGDNNNTTISSNVTRGAGNFAWTFTLFCNDPVFEEEEGVIKIKCHTKAANIYINTESDADPTDGSTLYNPTQVTTQNWTTNDKVRIKAIAVVSDGTNTASSDVVTLLNMPDITLGNGPYTYKGTEWEPTVTKVSIGTSPNETTAPTTPAAAYTSSYSNNTNVGTATLTLTDADESDLWYIWNASTTFTISPANVTVTAEDKTKEYGTNDPELTATITGLVNGESENLISYTISRTAGEDVGATYAITPSGQATQGNYSVTYETGTLTITKKNVTVKADDKAKTYGDADPALTVTITGLLSGDSESSINYNPPTREAGETAGTYTISISGESTLNSNYAVTFESGTFTINKKTLTVTARPKTITYGDAPSNDGVTYNNSEFVNNETEDVLGGTLGYSYDYSQYGDVGNYNITPNGLTATNYDFDYVDGTLTVSPKEVSLSWSTPTTFTYDGTSHGLTATATGLVNGDEVGVTVTGDETNAGNHTATASALTGAKASNYMLPTAKTQAFTITPAELTIKAKDYSITYGDAPANDGVTYSGFVNNETDAVLGGTLGYTYTYSQYDGVGDYDITPGGLTATNYNITFQNGTLTVDPKSIGDGDTEHVGVIATGFTLDFGAGNTIILTDGSHTLTATTDYTIGSETSESGRYTSQIIEGTGNYSGKFGIRNANVHLTNDNNGGTEYSATFVAESAGTGDIGHELPEGITAYIITSIMGDWAIPEQLDYIPAGVPVLLMASEEVYGFEVKDAVLSEDVTEVTETQIGYNMLEEVTETPSKHFNSKEVYLLYNNEFVWNKAGDLAKWKVYLNPNHVTPSPDPTPDPSPAPSRLKIAWHRASGMTELRNDELTELQNGAWYTIDGRRLNGKPSAKGLYIVEGKKVMIK